MLYCLFPLGTLTVRGITHLYCQPQGEDGIQPRTSSSPPNCYSSLHDHDLTHPPSLLMVLQLQSLKHEGQLYCTHKSRGNMLALNVYLINELNHIHRQTVIIRGKRQKNTAQMLPIFPILYFLQTLILSCPLLQSNQFYAPFFLIELL